MKWVAETKNRWPDSFHVVSVASHPISHDNDPYTIVDLQQLGIPEGGDGLCTASAVQVEAALQQVRAVDQTGRNPRWKDQVSTV